MNRKGMIIVDSPFVGDCYMLTGENFQNLLLWKPLIGGAITICSADKRLFRARLESLNAESAEVLVFEGPYKETESESDVILLQALPSKERMELIIQKTTELGVSSIIPFKSKRSICLEERDRRQKKSHRWPEIALKAAKQSRRAMIPHVYPYCSFADAVRMTSEYKLRLILRETERSSLLREIIRGIGGGIESVAVVIGPEGGFEESEIDEAEGVGFLPVGLGQRILRTETAAIVVIGIIQYELGNLG